MLRGRTIAVVVPARNEARWIGATVRSMPAFVDHVIVVDDASTDRTGELAQSAGGGRVRVVRHTERRGVGGAICSGYRAARDVGAAAIAVMAGDGQMHPDDLEGVVAPILDGRADYVKGERTSHPEVWKRMPLGRLAGTTVLAWLTRRVTGLDVTDAQCGFTAVAASALDALDLDSVWPGYGYCNDLLGAASRASLRVCEVPVRPVYLGQSSGLRPWHAATYAFVLGRLAARRITSALGFDRGKRPSPARDPVHPTDAGTLPAPPRAHEPAAPAAPP